MVEDFIMTFKNERGIERIIRLLLGGYLVISGYWISGIYWLGYQTSLYPIPCWNWNNFISNGCMVERGFTFAVVGLIALLTGLIGWCPIKAIFRIKI